MPIAQRLRSYLEHTKGSRVPQIECMNHTFGSNQAEKGNSSKNKYKLALIRTIY
jgi:hypothetical protein